MFAKISCNNTHCLKSVRIQSFSGPYSVQMRENTDQKNSEYGHFPEIVHFSWTCSAARLQQFDKGTKIIQIIIQVK